MRSAFVVFAVSLLGLAAQAPAIAQQVTVGTPFNTIGDSFFENIGVTYGIRGKNFSFQFGPGPAQPPFGNPAPGAGLTGGFANIGPHCSGFFNFNFAQGSRRSMVSQTPMITLPNGGTGYFGDTSTSPFVISMVPVVGGFPTVGMLGPVLPPDPGGSPMASAASTAHAERLQQWQRIAAERAEREVRRDLPEPPAAERQVPMAKLPERAAPPEAARSPAAAEAQPAAVQTSSADLAVPSVEDARRMHQTEQKSQQGDVRALYEKALSAESSGKPGVAKIYYQMVARRADGELREQAEARLQALASGSR